MTPEEQISDLEKRVGALEQCLIYVANALAQDGWTGTAQEIRDLLRGGK